MNNSGAGQPDIVRLRSVVAALLLLSASGQIGCGRDQGRDASPIGTADSLIFAEQIGAAVDSWIESEPLRIDWIDTSVPIAIDGGEYALDDDAYTASDGVVQPGQRLRLRLRSACALETTTEATVTVDQRSARFRVTTAAGGVSLVSITYPPGRAITNLETLTVRGTAAPGVQSIAVNGVAAISDDGFASWQAQLPLPPGDSTLAVQTDGVYCQPPIMLSRDDTALGTQVPLGSGPGLGRPVAMALDVPGKRLFVLDAERPALLAVDLRPGPSFGDRTLFDGPSAHGPRLAAPVGLGFDRREQRVVVVDRGLDALVAIDVAASAEPGSRSIVSGALAGPSVATASALAWFAGDRRVLVADHDGGALLAVDLPPDASGQRSELSGAGRGEGPALAGPLAIGVDASRPRAVVISQDALLEVDLASGDRRALTATTGGSRPGWSATISGLAVDAGRQRALILDQAAGHLIAVDIAEGASRGALQVLAPALEEPSSLAQHDDLPYVLVPARSDAGYGVEAIDLSTGDRVIITR